MTRSIPLTLALLCVAQLLWGCESDYTLGQETPAGLGTATPGDATGVTPPEFEATPTQAEATPEPGDFEALLRVEPPTLEFGPLITGCEADAQLRVINDGTVPVTVTNVRLNIAGQFVDLELTDDLIDTLYPGDEGKIWVEAQAIAIGEESVQLWIDAAEAPAAMVPIRSTVKEAIGEVVDTHWQKPENVTDVLWVIDNSGSMSDNQKRLVSNFDAFMDNFIPLDIRYHMGVVTTDMNDLSQSGRLQGTFGADNLHYIDWTMKEEGDEAFRQTIQRIGDDGSGAERGLIAMESALSPPLSSNYNAGFLRDEAFLSVIIVSDEEDQSPPDPITGDYVARYVGFLEELKGSLDNVVVSSILSYADSGGYVEVSVATGGVVHRINDVDYYQVLLDIGWLSAGYQTQFPLSDVPANSADIRLELNGLEVDSGPTTWSYDPTRRLIIFSDVFIPIDGARIDIYYPVRLTCDSPGGVAKATSPRTCSP